MKKDTPREAATNAILLEAARLIEKRGWIQGIAEVGHRVCLLRAIRIAGGDDRATRKVQKLLGLRPYMLADWNDTPGRTKAEVVRVLRKAART